MKKNLMVGILVGALACTGAFGLVACGSGDSEDGSSSEESTVDVSDVELEDNTLIVGFDAEYPPYGYLDEETGEYTGFDLDLAQEVCERCGWEFQAEPIDWDSKEDLIESGEITCIWNGFTYEGREDDYAFSDLYMDNSQVIVVRSDSGIEDEDDLAGKEVITQEGSSVLSVLYISESDLMETFADGVCNVVPDYTEAFEQLDAGEVDAVICDYSIATYEMEANEGAYYELEEELDSEHYAVGFALGDEDLAAVVTQTLEEMDEDGTVEELCEKYADQGISYENWCLGD